MPEKNNYLKRLEPIMLFTATSILGNLISKGYGLLDNISTREIAYSAAASGAIVGAALSIADCITDCCKVEGSIFDHIEQESIFDTIETEGLNVFAKNLAKEVATDPRTLFWLTTPALQAATAKAIFSEEYKDTSYLNAVGASYAGIGTLFAPLLAVSMCGLASACCINSALRGDTPSDSDDEVELATRARRGQRDRISSPAR